MIQKRRFIYIFMDIQNQLNIKPHTSWYKIPYKEVSSYSNLEQFTNEKEWLDLILSKFKASGKDEIIIINIGTDKCTGDCFGPFVGSLLESQNSKFKIYGTLENPIHSLNLKEKMSNIYDLHTNAFIICVDASVSKSCYLNYTYLVNDSIKPRSALTEETMSIGNISVVYNSCCVEDTDLYSTNDLLNSLYSVPLGNVYKAVREIVNMFNNLEKLIFN